MVEKGVNPLNVQIGGNHYKNFKIQPVEFIVFNGLDFLQGCIIKRICRYNLPGGKGIEDLEKLKHEVDLLIEFERRVGDCAGERQKKKISIPMP